MGGDHARSAGTALAERPGPSGLPACSPSGSAAAVTGPDGCERSGWEPSSAAGAEVDRRTVPEQRGGVARRLLAEVSALDDDALTERARQLAGEISAAEANLAAVLAEVERRGIHEAWECRTIERFAGWHCQLAPARSRALAEVGRAMPSLPVTAEAVADGTLGFDKARSVARVAAPATEGALVDLAVHSTVSQTQRICSSWRRVERQELDDPDPLDPDPVRPSVVVVHDEDGVKLIARFDHVRGHLVLAALETSTHLARAERSDAAPVDPADERRPGVPATEEERAREQLTPDEWRAEGLLRMADGVAAHEPSSIRPSGFDTTAVVHVGIDTLWGPDVEAALARTGARTPSWIDSPRRAPTPPVGVHRPNAPPSPGADDATGDPWLGTIPHATNHPPPPPPPPDDSPSGSPPPASETLTDDPPPGATHVPTNDPTPTTTGTPMHDPTPTTTGAPTHDPPPTTTGTPTPEPSSTATVTPTIEPSPTGTPTSGPPPTGTSDPSSRPPRHDGVDPDASHRRDSMAELEPAGVRVRRDVARWLACDAGLLTVIEDTDGNPLHIGRRRTPIPPALRRAVMARHRTCAWPGCTATAVQLHHLHHRWAGGHDDVENLAPQCPTHHRTVHVRHITITTDEHGTFHHWRPDGTEIVANPGAGRPGATAVTAPDALVARRLDLGADPGETARMPRWEGDPLDLGLCIDALISRRDAALRRTVPTGAATPRPQQREQPPQEQPPQEQPQQQPQQEQPQQQWQPPPCTTDRSDPTTDARTSTAPVGPASLG